MKPAIYLFGALLLITFSCKSGRDKDLEHTKYFDKLFAYAESFLGKDPMVAIRIVDSGLNALPDPGIKDLYRAYAYKQNCCQETRADSMAILYADSMAWVIRDHIKEKTFTELYAKALFRKGSVLIWTKDYAHAFECNYKARKAIEKIDDPCAVGEYTSTLAIVSFKQNKFEDAAAYMKQAAREMSSCPEDFTIFKEIQGRYDDIGVCYTRLGNLDSAMYYYQRALEYLVGHKNAFPDVKASEPFIRIACGVVYGNMGDIYLRQGDTLNAVRFYKQDAAINAAVNGDLGDGLCTLNKLASLYLTRKNFKEADTVLRQVKATLDTFNDRDDKVKWYGLMMDYMDMTRQYDKMHAYVKLYMDLKDSLAHEKQVPNVNIEDEYAHIKGQNDLMVSEKENQKKNLYVITFLISALLALGVASLLWFNWKRTRKLNAKVSRQNKELELALSSLNESQKENAQLMQVVAHDLRNPIASMVSIISILMDNKDLPEDDREMLALMNTSSQHAMEMIADLLNANTSPENMKKEPVDIKDLLRYSVDLLRFKANEKNQRIELEAEPAAVMVNKEKIWRVMNNLVVNAIKFSEEGKDITVKAYKQNKEYIIMVKDRGIGIPEGYQRRIFNMFSNARRPGTSGEKSFGLGLAISQKIIEAHGGRIWFESLEGVGTCFYIALPM